MKKPNTLHAAASVAACKLTRAVLRRTGRGGTAIPGIVGLKVSKNILAAVSQGMKIVVVTGTNGKTTTCNMIEHALTSAGHDCLLNKSGANLLHGIASDLICSADWKGKARHEYAVLECDEAALKQVVPYIRPRAIVVTNLFSDQVDRYGGVQNTLKEIRTGVERSPKSVLVLNAEDPLSASLAIDVPNKVVWYGLDKSVGTQGNVDLSDAGKCPRCGGDYSYDYNIYAHLGGFRCQKCGFSRQAPDVAVTSIKEKTSDGSVVHMRPGKKAPEQDVRIALPAVYNIYNAAASIAAIIALKLPAREAVDALSSARASFGRLETFDLQGNRLQMILVKNPAGCNQAFSYITGLGEDFSAVLCLNNRTGDGHDISWIETTDYEKLVRDPHLKKLYAGGDCAKELLERLKKAGAADDILVPFSDYGALVEKLKEEQNPVFLLPNYTAMMELRDALSPETGARDFWE
jgi:UDP-N-acetylmuramyl tripeptide synthase